jgi:hypothetical protein
VSEAPWPSEGFYQERGGEQNPLIQGCQGVLPLMIFRIGIGRESDSSIVVFDISKIAAQIEQFKNR